MCLFYTYYPLFFIFFFFILFFFQAEDGIRDLVRSRGLGDVYKRQVTKIIELIELILISSIIIDINYFMESMSTSPSINLSLIHI